MKKWIIIAICLFFVALLSVWAIMNRNTEIITGEETFVTEEETVMVTTVGHDGYGLKVRIVAPAGWVLDWKKDGKLLDSFTGEEAVADDFIMYGSHQELKDVYAEITWRDITKRSDPYTP
jgi:hypothetical protein